MSEPPFTLGQLLERRLSLLALADQARADGRHWVAEATEVRVEMVDRQIRRLYDKREKQRCSPYR